MYKNKPPSPPGNFLLGNALEFQEDPLQALTKWSQKHGDIFEIDVPFQNIYAVTHPNYIKTIIEEKSKKFRVGALKNQAFKGFSSDAIVLTDGDQWKRLRKILQPYFTKQTVGDYQKIILQETDRLIKEWEPGATLDLYDEMSNLTIRIVSKSLMGTDLKGREDIVKEAGDTLVELADARKPHANLPIWFPTPASINFKRAKSKLYNLIDEIKRQTKPGDSKLISHMIDACESNKLSEDELRENILEFFLAGSDTSSAALTFTFFCLEQNYEEKNRLNQIADEELARNTFEPSALQETNEFKWAVEEAMRIYPPAYAVARTANQGVTIGDYDFSEGDGFLAPQWVVQRDERFFDDPLEYRPERWKKRDEWPDYAEFPFGGGDRYCIGSHFAMLEMPMIVARILQRVDFEVLTSEIKDLVPSITLRPDHPVKIIIRNKKT